MYRQSILKCVVGNLGKIFSRISLQLSNIFYHILLELATFPADKRGVARAGAGRPLYFYNLNINYNVLCSRTPAVFVTRLLKLHYRNEQ